MRKLIYLDNQATTPTDPRVVDAMLPFLTVDGVGNPHSEHAAGQRAAAAVEQARSQVADLVGAEPGEIIFTSGATEANNIAVQGVAHAQARRGHRFITMATEHRCTLETMAYLKREGVEVEVLPAGQDGLLDLAELDRVLDGASAVSIMLANNEIGVLQPIAEIADRCRSHGVIVHTDAAQAVGKMPVDVGALGVDLLSISGHKLYAPTGVGALFVSRDMPLELEPLTKGGGQERGIRPGTVPTYLCVAFGEACAIAKRELEDHQRTTGLLRDAFLAALRSTFPSVRINGSMEHRLASNLSLTFPGLDADHLIGALQPDIALSAGSACSAGVLQPSHVLRAIGLSEQDANSSVRVGFGRFNVHADVEEAGREIARVANALREGKSVKKFAA